MYRIAFFLAPLLLAWAPFSSQAANKWNIKHEQIASFEAKVVDLLCELSGDCAPDCGAGKRQLGLLKADGTLLLAAKGNTLFAGAVKDLQPYCGQTIEVDGLLINDPEMTLYFVQRLRTGAEQEWQSAKEFGRSWAAENAGLKPPWWVNDPQIKAIIEQDGVLGIPGMKP